MIERERENFMLNEAKNVGDALASARLFNDMQDKISRSQPIDEFLNNFNVKKWKFRQVLALEILGNLIL